jgi:hypothetical protein
MSTLKNKLQHLISGQVPDYLKATYPKFVDFLKEYYRFLDSNRQANDLLLNSKNWSDVDLTLNMFVEEMFKQYAYNISPEVLVQQRRLIKFIHQFYESKGSENATELFFRMMYNDDAKISYPGDYVLRASDGKWFIKKTIKVDTDYNIIYGDKLNLATLPFAQIDIEEGEIVNKENPQSVFDLTEKTIYLRYQITDYDTFQFVNRSFPVSCLYVRRSVNNPDIFELDIEFSDIRSVQQINDEITSDSRLGVVWIVAKDNTGQETIFGFLTQQLISYFIEEGGENFRRRDTFVVDELEETALPVELASVQRINNGIIRVNNIRSTEVENYFGQEYVNRENEYTIAGLEGIVDSLRFISTGYRFDSSTGYFAEDYLSFDVFGEQYTRIVDNRARYFAQDYSGEVYTRFNEFTMDFINPRDPEETPAKVTFKLGYIYEHPGIWKDSSGFLSDINRLQDNYYYQPFSYVIQTVNTPYATWNQLYRNSAHPAGFEVFGQMIVEHGITFPAITVESGMKIDYMISDTVFAFDMLTKAVDKNVNDTVHATPYAIDYFEIPVTYTSGDSIFINYGKFDTENIEVTDDITKVVSIDNQEQIVITDEVNKSLDKNIIDVVYASSNYALNYFEEPVTYTASDVIVFEIGKPVIENVHPDDSAFLVDAPIYYEITDNAEISDSVGKNIEIAFEETVAVIDNEIVVTNYYVTPDYVAEGYVA